MARKFEHLRLSVQGGWTLLTNSHLAGFAQGRIYAGKLKSICLPGLNCYSCPGSLGSCPVGALQAVLSSAKYQFSFYLFGFFLIIGTVLGRFVCGFLCPFGLIQDLLGRIPFPKKIRTFKGDRGLRLVKYVILAVFVILLPLFLVDAAGGGEPQFCKWICPAGTLEGGVPLLLADSVLRSAAGFLFAWKLLILGIVAALSAVVWRPFCKYLCPLGAVYSLFNGISIYRYAVDGGKCTNCGRCARVCLMSVQPQKEANHPECVRCGECKKACPAGAISSGCLGSFQAPARLAAGKNPSLPR
ncbi:MAG: 4Fe-4S binding protein [Gracilibacteraceae bacterium]|nr:4Fe-4S binding protein [Gracilibacteraceae bacterium]